MHRLSTARNSALVDHGEVMNGRDYLSVASPGPLPHGYRYEVVCESTLQTRTFRLSISRKILRPYINGICEFRPRGISIVTYIKRNGNPSKVECHLCIGMPCYYNNCFCPQNVRQTWYQRTMDPRRLYDLLPRYLLLKH